jgi:hypothetical protein
MDSAHVKRLKECAPQRQNDEKKGAQSKEGKMGANYIFDNKKLLL